MARSKPFAVLTVVVLCTASFWALAQERIVPSRTAYKPDAGKFVGLAALDTPQLTNSGEKLPVIFNGHVLTVGQDRGPLDEATIAIRREAMAAVSAAREGVQMTNKGEELAVRSEGHILTVDAGARGGGILYAPTNPDNAEFRAAVSACTGMSVDYYDARVGTPSVALLCGYDCVMTWCNFDYDDAVLMGDRLATYVDNGCGKVILGQWCYESDQFNWLEGQIMTAAYCPVTVSSSFNPGTYAGDGADCVHYGPPFVSAYEVDDRDECTLVAGAQSDGTFTDGWPAVIWRQDRKVYYSPGNDGMTDGLGEWAELTCNMCLCVRGGVGGILYAPSQQDNPTFRQAVASCLGMPCDYFDARMATPSLALLSNYECVFTWVDFPYDDNVAFGDVLADYVDAGGRVVLGQWCYESDQIYWLEGRIMTAAYCPITSDSSYNSGDYAGDGVNCVHDGIGAYATTFLDNTSLVAGAFTDGTLFDGTTNRLSVSWRADRRVYYSAGNTGTVYGTGEWAELLCNMCQCFCADETTPPAAKLGAPPELGAGCACGIVDVEGTALDPDGTFEGYVLDYRKTGAPGWTVIASSDVEVDGGLLGMWDTTALSQGYYMLRLTARNVCGLASTAVRTVFVDQAYDSVSIDYPPAGHIIAGNVCIDGTVFESWCGSSYRVDYRSAGGGPWIPVNAGMPVYPGTKVNEVMAWWDTTLVADGDYLVRVRGENECGKFKTETINVTVDNTVPISKIDTPLACECVDGVVVVTGTAWDANLGSWRLQYTGGGSGGWVNITGGGAPVVDGVLGMWDTTGLPTCGYTLRLIVTDKAELGCDSNNVHRTDAHVSVAICCPGDINGDGIVDFDDIDPFVAVIGNVCP